METIQTPAEVIADLENQLKVYLSAKWMQLKVIDESRKTNRALSENVVSLETQVTSLIEEVNTLKKSKECCNHLIEMAISFMAGTESIERMQEALDTGKLTNYLQGINDTANMPIPSLRKLENN
ncbi:hypothetical protein [Arcticibacter eurypsychrophilus]|uniref:hypothetical protein n=1 Tax=Arcticibacter eurypsychrophilus TaxID=1434752 RepID=UPI00084DAD7B|nr:hypothetical protein [Arcticibacter eurypsychrophilus]